MDQRRENLPPNLRHRLRRVSPSR